MVDYNRTLWKDHIKDENGNVIQQGTPVSAKNLNNIENQVVVLSAKENSLSALVREAIPSGFTTLSDLDYSYMSTNPNSIRLSSDSVAYVNGYEIVIPSGTVINLDAPPTSGSRDDLVFLETWKQADANGAEQLSWRIRVVSGVDFSKYPEGLGTYCPTLYTPEYRNIVQGANNTPIAENWNTTFKLTGQGFLGQWVDFSAFKNFKDLGLYVAGKGDDSTKSVLGTTDGYVYAIPMFKVHRRNSGGYSINNGNGANNFVSFQPVDNNGVSDALGLNITVNMGSNISYYSVGDRVLWQDSNRNLQGVGKIQSISSNSMTIRLDESPSTANRSAWLSHYFVKCNYLKSNLFSNIVDSRDVIYLRHQVSLTGFNYQSLLEENFDKLLRGELQTNAKTQILKTYHGIPKTPIDSNHIFYCSFDGTTVAEIGGSPTQSYYSGFGPSVTGTGVTGGDQFGFRYPISGLYNMLTVDFIMDCRRNGVSLNDKFLFMLLDSNGNEVQQIKLTSGNQIYTGGTYSQGSNVVLPNFAHIRVTMNNGALKIYTNGKLLFSGTYTANISNTAYIHLFSYYTNSYTSVASNGIISDLSISNIDRGSNFATLQQDFIDGYARISTAFNTQRNVFSDALTSETTLAQVKCAGGNTKEITIGDSADWVKDDITKWNVSDRVKIRGLGGEIITGVIDTDTALTKVNTAINNSNVVKVLDVSKFSVGDTIMFYIPNYSYTRTITAIDTDNSTITLNDVVVLTGDGFDYLIFETTASSSSPVVKSNLTGTAQAGASSTITLGSAFSATDGAYNGLTITITSGTGAGQVRTISGYIGSTKVATVNSTWATNPDATSVYLITGVPVTGTWSGLGTNEATFTLGSNSGLVAQDLLINYSLNEVAGQGGISEVLTSVLAGEGNGKKLIVNPSIHIRDDFAGKVSGSTTICPNIFRSNVASSLASNPTNISAYNEYGTVTYAQVSSLDYQCSILSTNANGSIPQQLFSFNLIRIIEDKFGTLPCSPDTASKVAWLKANISKITFNWYGYGSCPIGNMAYIVPYANDGGGYKDADKQSHGLNSLKLLTYSQTTYAYVMIQSDGFAHLLAYTNASDGTTPSVIYTDYANIEITLNVPNGYDALTPENPRRDDGRGNVLLVRKETKEIRTMFPRNNQDGIMTYGNYTPYQGSILSLLKPTVRILAETNNIRITTKGSGGVVDNWWGYQINPNSVNRLPLGYGLGDYMFTSKTIVMPDNARVQEAITFKDANHGYYDPSSGGAYASSYHIGSYADFASSVNTIRGVSHIGSLLMLTYLRDALTTNGTALYVMSFMVVDMNTKELYMMICTSTSPLMVIDGSPNCAVDLYRLPSRPLMKQAGVM